VPVDKLDVQKFFALSFNFTADVHDFPSLAVSEILCNERLSNRLDLAVMTVFEELITPNHSDKGATGHHLVMPLPQSRKH
jgi:hypothetical protein